MPSIKYYQTVVIALLILCGSCNGCKIPNTGKDSDKHFSDTPNSITKAGDEDKEQDSKNTGSNANSPQSTPIPNILPKGSGTSTPPTTYFEEGTVPAPTPSAQSKQSDISTPNPDPLFSPLSGRWEEAPAVETVLSLQMAFTSVPSTPKSATPTTTPGVQLSEESTTPTHNSTDSREEEKEKQEENKKREEGKKKNPDVTDEMLEKIKKQVLGKILTDLAHGKEVTIEDINSKEGCAPVMGAVELGDTEILKVLLNRKANPDGNSNEFDRARPLHKATMLGNKEAVELLIKNGADVNIQDSFGDTPLHRAARSSSKEIVQLLLDNNANKNAQNNNNCTPLHLAVVNCNKEVVQLLLDNGVDINTKSSDGKSPLFFALELALKSDSKKEYYKEIAKLFLAHGPNQVNEKTDIKYGKATEKGVTALHVAVFLNDLEIIELLIQEGADIDPQDKEGNTPLHLAVYDDGKKEIAKFLIEKGASKVIKDGNGMTPYQIAQGYKSDPEFLNLLS